MNNKKIHTETEFFISAIADANSLKCNSGQYGIGNNKSPEFNPACTPKSSHSAVFVKIAP